jgi:hypothetical protein
MKIVEDIAAYLEAAGMETGGFRVYRYEMPDTPNDSICVYEYGGAAPRFSHSGMDYENQSVQIVVRSQLYQTARDRIEDIFLLLSSLVNFSFAQKMFLRFAPVQSPFPLGPKDNQNRHRMVVNFDVAVRA